MTLAGGLVDRRVRLTKGCEMEYLWMVAGAILGWVLVEFVAAATKTQMPLAFNFGLMFVGGLIGYSVAA